MEAKDVALIISETGADMELIKQTAEIISSAFGCPHSWSMETAKEIFALYSAKRRINDNR